MMPRSPWHRGRVAAWAFTGLAALGALKTDAAVSAPPVAASESGDTILLSNGIVSLTIAKSKGTITSIKFRNGSQETETAKSMYFDSNGGPKQVPKEKGSGRPRAGYAPSSRYVSSARLGAHTGEISEAVLNGRPTFWFPFQTEVHYLLRRGESGFYAWVVFQHGDNMPAASVGQSRFVIRGPAGTELYTHHVVDDLRKGPFPTSPIVKEVMDATYLLQDGSIYTKYDNTAFNADDFVHGMAGHGVGLWVICASSEFKNGGPIKQELTVHIDNALLCMLQGGHFGGGDVRVADNEHWSKCYGPFFVYMNAAASIDALHADAKRQAAAEVAKWPYRWAEAPEYPVNRSAVSGRIRMADGGSPEGAWVILADPGIPWTDQANGYEFWTKAGKDGAFTIPNVRPGNYTLYASGAGQFEDFHRDGVCVQAGRPLDLGTLAWEPVKHGQTLWQIGTVDHSSGEFKRGDDYRHWANYLRYQGDFPDDVTFVVGKGKEAADWNFAQWTWYSKKPVWTIQFDVGQPLSGKAWLTIGFAASNPLGTPPRGGAGPAGAPVTNLQVKVNGAEIALVHLPKTGAAAYRSGNQDSPYHLQCIEFDATLLKPGTNEITLGHLEAQPFPSVEEQKKGKVGCVMYDAIRLEVAPGSTLAASGPSQPEPQKQ